MTKMLTDDPFLLTGILLVVMIPLYILIIKKLRPTQPRARTVPVNHASNANNHNFKVKKKNHAPERKPLRNPQSQPEISIPEHMCYHDFGYLRSIPKNSSIPNDCLGCPKIVECLTHD
jgi:hypothetical protein